MARKTHTLETLTKALSGGNETAETRGIARAYIDGNFDHPDAQIIAQQYRILADLGPTAVGIGETISSDFLLGKHYAAHLLFGRDSEEYRAAFESVRDRPLVGRMMKYGLRKTHPATHYGVSKVSEFSGFTSGVIRGGFQKAYGAISARSDPPAPQ